MPSGGGWASLESLRTEALVCRRCRLAATRTQVVFGEGDPDARLVIVGEAPGGEEDREGRPFVGRAGRQLQALLADAGLGGIEAYFTNAVLCHPPGSGSAADRAPLRDEIGACAPYLRAQLDLTKPRAVLVLGRTAARAVLGRPAATLEEMRGRVHETRGMKVVATYHPSPSGLNRDPGRRAALLRDLRDLASLLGDEPGNR
jgi:uracil-DNA glycosylase family 4